MKKILFTLLVMFAGMMTAAAQAQIKFDKTVHSFGQFSEGNSKQSCVFTFTNTGDKPLVINQTVASCGCTTPTYTKTPVLPGEKGEVKVVYNGAGRFPGHFKKTITVRTNGTPEVVRLYIEGDMTEAKK
ncbi:MAG: DUF1573 domain-containing protein [Bacteroidales bacterium]|nr:DUF1573 domain-containing protein [Bacteroidales bacterium]MCM1147778.1 DUF1573 domain-containing protein [Bacteroidales bacterium]MCM1206612.1 DUF1573 domain-containing protein [Bacillota bacterium]MCM1510647.1 DUF1573 domain-containing protein [Clostridium sp.]